MFIDYLNKYKSMQKSFINFVLNNRLVTAFLALLLFAITTYGAQFLTFKTDYRVFFGKDNPQLATWDQLQDTYTKTDNLVFVIKTRAGQDIFNKQTISLVKDITKAAWQLPYSTRVDSITNYQHTEADGDNLLVMDMVEQNPDDLTDAELAKIKRVITTEPLLKGKITSDDLLTTGVSVTFNLPQKDVFEVPQVMAKARQMAANFKTDYPNHIIKLSGIVPMNNAFGEASQGDMQSLVPLMLIVTLVVLALAMRSTSASLATLVVIILSSASAMGIAGWLGIGLTPPSVSAPTIILTLAIADSVHIIISMLNEMRAGRIKREAIKESLRINFQPVFLTSFTTIVGFLCLNFSDAPPFHDLGNITAIGVGFAFLYSVTILPVLLDIAPIKVQPKSKIGAMEKLGNWVVNKRKILFPASLATVFILAIAVPKIELNDEFLKYFDESVEFRRDADFMLKNLTGIYTLEYSVPAELAQGITKPEYQQNLDKFATWLRTQPEVTNIYTMTDIFKRLNKNMHGDDASYYRVPDNKNLAAQYLLMYEFSLPYGLDVNDRINIDKSATRMTATLRDMSTNDIRALTARIDDWAKQNMPSYMATEATSPVIMFSHISERNINSMIKGNAIALLLISLTIMLALKSFRIGLFSLIPNIVPAIMAFGLWYYLIGQVNMGVAVVASLSLGIIVDDTVHFLSKYLRARREKGYDAPQAVIYSFNTVGRALVVTTFALIIGFLLLSSSSFQINEYMGKLTAITIACALIADFILLPIALVMFDKGRYTKDN